MLGSCTENQVLSCTLLALQSNIFRSWSSRGVHIEIWKLPIVGVGLHGIHCCYCWLLTTLSLQSQKGRNGFLIQISIFLTRWPSFKFQSLVFKSCWEWENKFEVPASSLLSNRSLLESLLLMASNQISHTYLPALSHNEKIWETKETTVGRSFLHPESWTTVFWVRPEGCRRSN